MGVARRILLKGGWLGVGMARRRRRVCEFFLERRGKEIITNVKRMNILLNKYVE